MNTLEKSEVKIIKKPKEEFDTAIFKTKTDIFRLGKPTKNQRALRKELSQSLKDLEKGLLFKPIIQRVGKKEKLGFSKI